MSNLYPTEDEKAFLGAVLEMPQLLDRYPTLTPGKFDAALGHDRILRAIYACRDAGDAGHLAVVHELTRTGDITRIGARKGGAYLHDLMQAAQPSLIGRCARLIAAKAQLRALLERNVRINQALEKALDGVEPELALDVIAEQTLAMQGMLDDPLEEAPIEQLWRMGAFADRPQRTDPWVIPGVLRRQERVLLIAPPKSGKTMLARQVAVLTASGRNPFEPRMRISPQRVLMIDLENPGDLIQAKTRPYINRARDEGFYEEDGAWIWHRLEPFNIRDAGHLRLMNRVIAEVRPALVCIGPLYKLAATRGDSWEVVAEETSRALDMIRATHDCALWIEHHMPKSSNQGEAPTPFGSSLWERWIEFGFALIPDPKDPATFMLRTFTPGQRDERAWPESLTRGTEWPWRANWPPEIKDQIDQILLQQVQARKAGAA